MEKINSLSAIIRPLILPRISLVPNTISVFNRNIWLFTLAYHKFSSNYCTHNLSHTTNTKDIYLEVFKYIFVTIYLSPYSLYSRIAGTDMYHADLRIRPVGNINRCHSNTRITASPICWWCRQPRIFTTFPKINCLL